METNIGPAHEGAETLIDNPRARAYIYRLDRLPEPGVASAACL